MKTLHDHIMNPLSYSPYELAQIADCGEPEFSDTPGAAFLRSVQDNVNEALKDISPGDDYYDVCSEIAEAAIPVYTHEMWQTFLDLEAYREDSEHVRAAETFQPVAVNALYDIAYRLAVRLFAEALGEKDES